VQDLTFMRSLPRFFAFALAASSLAATGACTRDESAKLQVPITAVTACPKGAMLEGEAPPKGLRQRCQKDETTRHGISRDWWKSGRERTYSEWWEGERHGRFLLWYESGKLKSESMHRFGVPAGRWRYLAEDGTVQQEQTFDVAPPEADWVAQAIAGKEPVRDVPPPDLTGVANPESLNLPGVAPNAPTKAVEVKAPDKDAVNKPAPAHAPAPVDPVFARGTPGH
jgi:hypothetical protein